jgi:lipopolysaccharide biosynthesis regulator YciM
MSDVDVKEEILVVEVLASPAPPDPSGPVRARLLRMADGYRRAGAPNQAIEMYFELVERDGETPEGQKAREGLMTLCEEYERAGKLRQARALYERLL